MQRDDAADASRAPATPTARRAAEHRDPGRDRGDAAAWHRGVDFADTIVPDDDGFDDDDSDADHHADDPTGGASPRRAVAHPARDLAHPGDALSVPGQPLFRAEALEAQRSQWLGHVLLAPRRSHRWFTLAALLVTAGLVALLMLGEFARKAPVSGWLVPEQGLIKVYAPQAGVITEVKVKEGAQVRAGEVLFVVSSDRQNEAGGSTEREVARLLAERRRNLEGEIDQQGRQLSQQRQGMAQRMAAIRAEIRQFDREIAVQQSRTELARAAAQRMRDLSAQGFASRVQLQQTEDAELDQAARTEALLRTRAERQRELVTLQTEAADLPLRSQTTVSTLNRDIAALEQELAQAESRRGVVITAPQDGTVTSLQGDKGSTINLTTPLLSLIPQGAVLQAQLFAPSRDIGFVKPGQSVKLRYEAFPYQKFGHAEGRVLGVSQSALSPAELPSWLVGVVGGSGTGANGARPEPVYRIDVALPSQTIAAFGEQRKLQAGMQLESDIILERRKIYEWVLEPLYTITGKL